MTAKASPAGWVVQVTIAAGPSPPSKEGARWIGDKMPGAPSFEYFNVAIVDPDKAIKATTTYLAKGKLDDAEDVDASAVRELSLSGSCRAAPQDRRGQASMTAKAKPPSNKAVQRFVNEGGTTRAGELARKKRPRDANQLGKSIVDIATGETEDREPTPEEPKRARGTSAGKAVASRFEHLHGGRHPHSAVPCA